MQSIWARLGIALAAVLLVSSYQNCGQAPAPNSEPVEEEDQIVRAMEQQNQDGSTAHERAISSQKVNAGTECRVENLRCFRKVYSPQAQDHSLTESICVDGTCLDVQTHSYDTRTALAACEHCGPEAAAPGGEYNREEYTCWLGEPGASPAQAFALRSTFESAVKSTLAACAGDQQ